MHYDKLVVIIYIRILYIYYLYTLLGVSHANIVMWDYYSTEYVIILV